MSKSIVTRIVRLESVGARQPGGLLVASTEAEAERLRAVNPKPLIIITGVPRSSSHDGDER